MLFELDAEALLRRALPRFAPLPRQQSAWRDIAVVAGDERHPRRRCWTAIAAAAGGVVRAATLFDIYEPQDAGADIAAGERSLAVRLELLDDAPDADRRAHRRASSPACSASLEARLGVRLRAQ